MSRLYLMLIVLAVFLAVAVPATAANHYSLAFWRNWSGQENGQSGPGDMGNAFMRVFVFDENGAPVKDARVWFEGVSWGNLKTSWILTDDRGHVEYGFQFAGSPCKVWVTDNSDTSTATYDVTPQFLNHDNHRAYDIGFMRRSSPASSGLFNTSHYGSLLEMSQCPFTYSLSMNTPVYTDYYSGVRSITPSGFPSFGQTFVANSDRAIMMRAHLTKGFGTIWRYSAQIFEGGPDGPPMGPKKNLKHNYISDDIKYFLGYGTEECALKPGNIYYVKFTAADGTVVNGYECTNDIYPDGILYENDVPVAGKDLQCYVVTASSQNTNTGTVAGTVTNADASVGENDKIEEAFIKLSPGGKTMITGKAGTYKCYNVAPGTYDAEVSATGFQTQTFSGLAVSAGGTVTSDFALSKDAGPIDVIAVSVSGGSILPGATSIPVAITAKNADATRDVFVDNASPTFWLAGVNRSSLFAVTADPSNPAVIHAGETKAFSFTADCSESAPVGNYTVQGRVCAYLNLQPNGSFEQDASIPNYTGPTGWDWRSDDPPSVARVSHEQGVTYAISTSMPTNTAKVVFRYIGKWSSTNSASQGVRVYWPKLSPATGQWRAQLDIRCGLTSHIMQASLGTGDKTYSFTFGKYYKIEGYTESSSTPSLDGKAYYTITPLEEPGKAADTITISAASSTNSGGNIKWGKMNGGGTEEMSCREFYRAYYDSSGNLLAQHDWLATNGILPTLDGWQFDTEGNQAMLPGAPWSADSLFNVTETDKKEGSRGLEVWCSPTGGGDANLVMMSTGSGVLKPRMVVKPSTTYRVSYWYKQGHYTSSPAYLRTWWEMFDSAGNKYYYEPDGGVGYRPPFHWDERETVSGGEWIHRDYVFTTQPDTATAELLLRMDKRDYNPVADVFAFDDFRMTEINSYGDVSATTPGTLIVTEPVPVDTVADAKQQPNGTTVVLTGIAVTGKPANVSSQFYIEDDDRQSGLLVKRAGGSGPDVAENDVITIRGTLATVDGERCLIDIVISNNSSGTAPEALALIQKSLGGSAQGYTPGVEGSVGLNNVGLLVMVFGSISLAGDGCFYLDDGSGAGDGVGQGVKVFAPGMAPPEDKTHATVRGFCSVEIVGGKAYAVVKLRSITDVVWY